MKIANQHHGIYQCRGIDSHRKWMWSQLECLEDGHGKVDVNGASTLSTWSKWCQFRFMDANKTILLSEKYMHCTCLFAQKNQQSMNCTSVESFVLCKEKNKFECKTASVAMDIDTVSVKKLEKTFSSSSQLGVLPAITATWNTFHTIPESKLHNRARG